MTDFKENKPSRDSDFHIALLKERGLIITLEDEIEIKVYLNKIGYYRLSGYFGPLQNPKDSFKPGKTFKDIIRLYEFDKQLRVITSYAVKSIEIKLKSYITDLMSLKYESTWYSDSALFYKRTKKDIIKMPYIDGDEIKYQQQEKEFDLYKLLIEKINDSISKNSEKAYIRKFKDNYGSTAIVPSWMMMECISFGALSKLYSLMVLDGTTRKIAKDFGCPVSETFNSWLHGFVVLRNHCAHHARLWNIRPAKDLQFPKRDVHRFHTANDSNTHLFYGIGCCLLQVLKTIDEELYIHYKTHVKQLMLDYGIDKKAMGFPMDLDPWDVWN
ncbi:hypothetical protein CNR22_14170 [Sphingobacteriaceae bacterium]|nr:hypothetical protein CNR22_14170 [Sphingobacteriaceae bacterium]